ncbi:hypothetical protein [Paenibacillus polymyxa]|uniref:M1-348 n=1 Tax=Paenibacillus polymyxa (strain SC2) TaxID=886882 RepID=E3EGG9_PAEPS|nr:hypothetical protein [Paenibacillus polymyxa]ADO54197.1 M1-348 [Paenibacillus polymyxa SC2]WPQ57120.1 hypothetical protein SKN87_01075 [Paenibacillus polymyxa]CCC83129.1 hypothetical protein PPM_0192 [Paenibacillus polymyxa M1]
MLFQMCYGPEIESIYETIREQSGIKINTLREYYQYTEEGDITSLIEGVITILLDLHFIRKEEGVLFAVEDKEWSNKEVFKRLSKISLSQNEDEESLNYIFSSLYNQVFVKQDKMFETNIHYHVNKNFTKTMIGHEKINAWKRMMESWGLGRRVYTGFYALPHISLLQEIVEEVGEWEGALHLFCEEKIHPVLPCITSEGMIFRGAIFGLMGLQHKSLEISYKQDLPFKSYGPNQEWNWIQLKKKQGDNDDTMSK